jgi:hypothetical protein
MGRPDHALGLRIRLFVGLSPRGIRCPETGHCGQRLWLALGSPGGTRGLPRHWRGIRIGTVKLFLPFWQLASTFGVCLYLNTTLNG